MDAGLQTGTEGVKVRRRRPSWSRVVPVAEICKRLDLTQMTVVTWRRGSPVRRPLPSYEEPIGSGERHKVVIYERDLLDFLEEYRPDLLERWTQST